MKFEAKHAPDCRVNDFELHAPGLNFGLQWLSVAVNSRKFHIESGGQGEPGGLSSVRCDMMEGHKIHDGRIIRDDDAREAEFVAQQLGQDGGAACTGEAVNRSVGVHHCRESGVADHGGKRFGIDLTQFSWAALHGTPVASTLRHGIAKEVLAGGSNAVPEVVALKTLDIGSADDPAQHRFFAVGLLYSSPAHVACDVENRCQRVSGTDGHHLRADNPGHLFNEARVPGRCKSKSLGKNGRIPVAEPTRGLLVEDDGNAKPRPFDGDFLDSVNECGALLRMQAS